MVIVRNRSSLNSFFASSKLSYIPEFLASRIKRYERVPGLTTTFTSLKDFGIGFKVDCRDKVPISPKKIACITNRALTSISFNVRGYFAIILLLKKVNILNTYDQDLEIAN